VSKPGSAAFRSRWKRHEREVAEQLGVRRNPNSGEGRADIDAPPFSIQHKLHAKSLPAWFTEAMEQAKRDAGCDDIPVVVHSLSQKGKPTQRWVVMEWEGFHSCYDFIMDLERDRLIDGE
jgi:hypothetical protein